MCTWDDAGYSPDWSNDFFEAGQLPYREDIGAYIVDDVEYCIKQALDWQDHKGDYADDGDVCDSPEARCVFVDDVYYALRVTEDWDT